MLTDIPDGGVCYIDATIFYYHLVSTAALSDDCSDLLMRMSQGRVHGVTSSVAVAEATHKVMLAEVVHRHGVPLAGLIARLKRHPELLDSLTHHQELLEKLAALVPLPRMHLVRYGGCLAPHSHLRRGHHPHAPPAGDGRRGAGHRVATLELGTTAEAGVCAGHGALSVLSAGDAADHRGHYTWRGDPEDPPASQTRRRPALHRPSPSPPRSLCLVLGLAVSGLPPMVPSHAAERC
jgi:predicted nucleic acid-binding protein